MSRRVQLPPHLASQAFGIGQARNSGVNYGRTRSSDLVAPFHGTRAPADRWLPATPEDAVRQLAADYAPRLKPGQCFCELTSLVLFGAPVPRSRRDERKVHVGAIPPRMPPRARGTRPHYTPLESSYVTLGLPVCSPVDAWLQCGGSLARDELVLLGDALVRRQNPLTTLAKLESRVLASSTFPGIGAVRDALALIRPRTDSPPETEVRLMLLEHGLPEPAVNLAILDDNGRFLGFGDLVYPDFNVVIEYDGEYHFGLTAQRVKDLDRIASFVEAGRTVVQVHKEHLTGDRSIILGRIRRALVARGWRG